MTLRYTIKVNPAAGTYLVELEVNARDELLLRMPAWLPGSYMIRDMAAEVQSIEILCGSKKQLIQKIDKSTWRAKLNEKLQKVRIRYEVFAQDPSVRRAYLDDERGFITFSSLCLLPVGFEAAPVEVDIRKPKNKVNWKVASSLQTLDIDSDGFGLYSATDYDELIDSPVELGSWQSLKFKAYGVEHRIILSGKVPPFDKTRLINDVKRCTETVIAFFDPKTHRAPFASYTFFLNLTESLYGGLEHRASTALVASFYDLPIKGELPSSDYGRLLELFTHEYFHAWWVKRVKPSVFIPYDLTQESYTGLLWVFEGFTSYYDALLTARSGATDKNVYLKSLQNTLNRHLTSTAGKRQSLAESSFDAWIKYYKVRTNRSRAVTSYYDKGALVALALDACIRKKTAGKKSLDDVLRYAWQQFVNAQGDYAGLDEEVMSELILDATGVDLTDELDRWVFGCEEPDYEKLLKTFGISSKKVSLEATRKVLQAKLSGADTLLVSQLDEGGSAEEGGLCVGDELVAIDGIRVRKANLEKLLKRYAVQSSVKIHVFRAGVLKECQLKFGSAQKSQTELKFSKSDKTRLWL